MVSPGDAERLRLAQAGIRALVLRDLSAMFGSIDLARPEHARDALLAYMPALVRTHGEQAAAVAADWYDEVRAKDGAAGRFRAVMAGTPYADSVDGLTRRAAGALFTDRPEDALEVLQATAPKYVLGAARQTIATSTWRDPKARGWQRVTRGDTCKFCVGLAQRGAVYTRATAHFAAHGSCDCAAVPSWDPDAPEVDVFAYEASARMGGLRRAAALGDRQAARAIAEHNARIRTWLDSL